MRYNVRWKPATEQQLAQIWNDATDKAAVALAADAFDAALQRDALQVGESRTGRTRIAFAQPLAFLFDVYPDTRQVEVFDVWRTRR
jgi:hypothetical protein